MGTTETTEKIEMQELHITNVHPDVKTKLVDIAKEESITLAPMIRKILKRAIKNYDKSGDFFVTA